MGNINLGTVDNLTSRDTCRLCGGPVDVILPLHPIPIADGYTETPPEKPITLYPVDLYACAECGHMQLVDIINPELLFSDYHFRTSENAAMLPHLRAYADDLMQRFDHATVMEIGSNDGTLLRHFMAKNSLVLGFDPSNVETDVPTRRVFFDEVQAKWAMDQHGRADIIIANHVFAHSDNLHGMAAGVKTLLAPDGVFVMECAYGIDLLERRLYDQIHHEHLSYHHVTPLLAFFQANGMRVIDAERNECKGGSVRLFVKHNAAAGDPAPRLEHILSLERSLDIPAMARRMLMELNNARARLAPYANNPAFGAGPGATTLIGQLELQPDFLVDDNPRKHGLYSPWGMPIRAQTDERETVLLSTRYSEQIMKRHPGEWVYSV